MKVGTAEVELRVHQRFDDEPLAIFAFWHLSLVVGLVMGLLLGALR